MNKLPDDLRALEEATRPPMNARDKLILSLLVAFFVGSWGLLVAILVGGLGK